MGIPQTKADEKMVHPWERDGFGKAPFAVTGFSESVHQAGPDSSPQPAGTCDVCGNGIRYVCHIRSADGKSFKVGCDCVRKTADARLVPAVESHERLLQRNKKYDRDMAKLAAIKATLDRPETKVELVKHPHPLESRAAKGETLWDWADWTFSSATTAGRLDVGRTLAKMGLK